MISKWLMLGAVISQMFASAMANGAEIYRNDRWGVVFPYPKGLSDCAATYYGADHGPVMFLDPTVSRQCDGEQNRRAILMFNFYNVTEKTATLKGLLEFGCNGRCSVIANGLKFYGRRSLAARSNHADGWIDIVVVTQGGRDSFGNDNFVNYSLTLHTDRAHFDADFGLFQSLLSAVKLTPPTD